MTRLPPSLTALRTFVEAARAQSFTRAARSVHVTQGAVSRQMRALEDALGTALFARTARSVTLTPAGSAYLAEVERAFAILERATEAIARGGRVVLSVLPSFASLWLLPRLPRFEQRHPDIRVELLPSYELADLHGGEVHGAIRYGRGIWPNVRAHRILRETLVPVASPAVARRLRGRAVWSLPLLSAGPAASDSAGDLDWGAWAEGARVAIPSDVHYRRLRDYQRVVHAAQAGHGVALARIRLVGGLLENGSLVPVDATRVTGKTGHYFVCSEASWRTPAVRTLFQWLRSQARASARRA